MSKTAVRKLEVGNLKPGMTVQFPSVLAIVRSLERVEKENATIDGNVLILELIGGCGPFKNKRTKIYTESSKKLDVVFHRFLLRRWVDVVKAWFYLPAKAA